MTPAERAYLKRLMDVHSRGRFEREIVALGAFSCLKCGTPMLPEPRRRYCSKACRLRAGHGRKPLAGRGCSV